MNNELISNLMSIFVFALLYLTFLVTPKITRKDLIFGVSIPLDRTKDEEIKKISKSYYIEMTGITLIIAIIYFIILNKAFSHPLTLVLFIFIIIGVYFVVFLRANKKMKKYKSENNLMGNKKQVVYVDTNMSKTLRKDAVIHSIWFIIPGAIALINLILPLMNYDKLPAQIAMHWNIQGVADSFVDKSIGSVISTGLMPLMLVGILTFTNYSIAISKNKIDASNPASSSQKLFKFKKINSIMIYCLAVGLTFLLTTFNLKSYNFISFDIAKFTPFLILFLLVVVIGPITISIKLGQGGSNLKDKNESDIDSDVINVDDDEFWKLGSFYYNPNDPSIFVEKRFGSGWTLNFGNKTSIVISVVFLIFVAIMIIVPFIFS